MSRIFVNNLPKCLTNDKLGEIFSQKGEVTEATVRLTRDGKSKRSRQFGFVGFSTEHEAQEAIKHFNNSFIDTLKLTCEIALRAGDPNLPRPWSLKKHKNSSEEGKRTTCLKGPKAAVTEQGSKKRKKDNMNYEPELEEFLQVMQPRSRSKLFANDTLTAPSLEQSRSDGQYAHSERIKGKGTVSSKKQEEAERNIVVNDDFVSDSDNLGHVEGVDEYVSADERKNKEFLESGRLYVVNIPYAATEEELGDHFSKYGSISQVNIVVDKYTKRSKGFGYVSFALPESAARALEETNGSAFRGRALCVMPAKPKKNSDKQEIDNSGSNHTKTFKQERNAEKKASEASGNTQAWNSFYMRSDTVVENIARELGVSKGEILDKESDGLAVRVALAETRVIAETKKALSSAGVNIASLEQCAAGKTEGLKRSNHVILVKNLPYDSAESELWTMFENFGSLDKIIIPPTKTLALVSFLEPAEARAAFKGLAYGNYKGSPLYLEWPPDNILSKIPIVGDNAVAGRVDGGRGFLEQHVAQISEADVDHDRIESRSIYVKNLSFKTSDEKVKKHFTKHMKGGEIISVGVKKHQKNGKHVSMGFGFIEFDSVDTAVKVYRDLQGTVLDGHALVLQLCRVKKDGQLPKKSENNRSSTKLVVKNVAFESTKKDLRQLLSPFGQIKSLRLPKRFGNHRGFGFVEYVTKQEARNVLEALSSTHLYNRHLVLERAEEGESIEKLRAKTAAQFNGTAKLSKKRKHLTTFDQGNIEFQKILD